ncbi:ISL3 family transposase [Escherichia coli]|uniref:ISL3 family transposase n=2 Tax=Escherichia coli TaxID=562 RepID=UPI000DFA4946|nr:ISL3 family transposase [Escherichia coli]EEW5202162.1 ISL3 family transposase [Escherichia coli]EFA7893873.1 ISL3 family transposase [Escherichia coli]EFH1398854.1 ISL3 family transposase [Escherichia coli]EFN9173244.1 ISL3 family transposase [Escherichia coli]EHZ0012603.1 ISL3 family transposase [Escherichia coli]
MGNSMHSLKTLLQLPCGWRCSRQIISSDGITLHLHGKRKTAQCPECFKRSDSVHSCRRRRIQHLPCSGQTLWLVFSVRHWYCRNPACSRKIFAGSLAPFAGSHQQSSQALQNLQRQLGLIAGGEAGKRAATAAGLRCSADTLLRRVINTPETKQSGAPHVGIDEWAWHRGHRYGTLIVNLDTHRPLVLLPGRDQRTLATWFRKYPEIQIVSRDRSGVYATAAREGAPQARQVANRWHLLKNIGDVLERMMYRHMPLIRLVASELSPKKSPDPEPSVPAASLRRPERLKQQTRKKRHQRWTEVMALHNKGCSFREISRITGLSRVTVSRWVRSGTFPEMSTRPPKRGLLDPWREWLKEQRESGNYNASRIWREMVARGFTGSETIVRDAVAKWRKGWNPPVTTAVRLPSVSRVSRWLMPWRITRDEENYASRFISLMCEKEPELKIAQQLALEFYRILKTQNKSQLSSWFTRVHESGSAEFRRVAAGMEADAAAICEAINSSWSNGVVEGHVNRLKMLKRQMYGRAGFELLRQRVMSPLA